MDKFIVVWFEAVKIGAYILLGLIPAAVYYLYASSLESYDALYSIIVWALLFVIEFGNIAVNLFINKSPAFARRPEETEIKLEGVTREE